MPLDEIKEIIDKLDNCETWSVNMLKFKSTEREGYSCFAREIKFRSNKELMNYISSIKENYIGKKSLLEKYIEIREYDGSTEGNVIYELDINSELVKDSYEKIMHALLHADQEMDPFRKKYDGYVLSGNLMGKEIHLFKIHSPFVNLENRYILDNSFFSKIKGPILSLMLTVDVMIYGEKIFLFKISVENLFNMEKAYKAKSENCINEIIDSGIVEGIELFQKFASSGQNPRRFIKYDASHLEELKNEDVRKRIGVKFSIPMKEGKYIIEDEESVDKLIKVLCKRGMLDPFDDAPMEVSGSKNWS